MADGPATFGTPVRSDRPGVYIIELPAPVSAAPIDFNAVGRWIERVPTLTVDGATPTGRDLAARLHGFWVPDQTVLYIGQSGASIGSRVGAFVRTPLGDRRPYAGGYWLKTLVGLDKLRVWWAETDATEEYEDALFGAFAAAVPAATAARLHDPDVVLPFANLQTADKVRKRHGIAGALLPDDADRPASACGSTRGGRCGPGPGRQRERGLRSRTALRSSGSTTARRRAPTAGGSSATGAGRAAAAGPVTGSKAPKAPTRLSEAGLEALRAELEELTTVTRPAIVARIDGCARARRPQGELGLPRGAPRAVVRRGSDPGDRGPAPERRADRGRRQRRSGAAGFDGGGRRTARRRGDVHAGRLDGGQPRLRPDLGHLADRRRAARSPRRRRGRGGRSRRAAPDEGARGPLESPGPRPGRVEVLC